ncbi:MAG: cytidine deaminase [Acidobacteriota bacterium]
MADSKAAQPWSGDRRSVKERRAAERRAAKARAAALLAGGAGEPAATSMPVSERRARERRGEEDRRSEMGWVAVPLEETAAENFDRESELLAAALEARTRAHAQYSQFRVGAALETADGRIITGCNIENATYGLTLCAERVALVKALSDGHSGFTRIAVVADTKSPTPPCGPCRQLLWEYCGDIDIILGNLNGPMGRFRLSALLPLPFDARLLG